VLLLCLALYADRPLTLSLDPGVTMTAPDAQRPAADQPRDDLALATRHAPILHFDREEPFLPSFAGYTIFRRDADSASFPRRVTLRPRFPRIDERDAREIAGLFPDGRLPEVPDITAAVVIEYAIWWDWDIQHLYELEHAWSYVGADGELLYAEASWHGGYFPMLWDGATPQRDGHPLLYSQPGKHAFVPDPRLFTANDSVRADTHRACSPGAGNGGLLLKDDLFGGRIAKDAVRDALATAYLKGSAFEPSFAFTRTVRLDEAMLVPWPALDAWIPRRIDRVLADLGEAGLR
jgi:putative hydrolase of the HAD superfamily